MLFHSYFFLFVFLPLALAGWYLFNQLKLRKAAQGYLIGMSLWFYAYFNVDFLCVMLGSCLFNYGLSFLLAQKDLPGRRKFFLTVGCLGNVGALAVFKYTNFMLENMNAVCFPWESAFLPFSSFLFSLIGAGGNWSTWALWII